MGRSNAWRLAAILVCIATTPGFSQLAQQQGAPLYRVSGTVADPQGSPVADAEVSLIERDSATRFVRSDTNGRFEIDKLLSATPTFRVRRLGFQARTVEVRVTNANHTATVFVSLEPSVAKLGPVIVDEEGEPTENPRLVEFYDRSRRNNFGHYVDEAMLAKLHPHHASEALRSVPGVVIRPSGRIGNTVRLRGCGVPGESASRPGPLIWLDGIRVPGAELDEVTQGTDLAAIEIYNSFAGIPPQFFDRSAVCGTIVVWSKSR